MKTVLYNSAMDQNNRKSQQKPSPKWVINPSEVSKKDEFRVRQWALSIMKKYEHKLLDSTPDKGIVYKGEVEPEQIDVRNIYPFADLNWFIHRDGKFWCFTLLAKGVILFRVTYAKF